MKKLVVVLVAVLLVAGLAAPTPALAWWGFWPGFGVGAFTGLVLGGALAAPFYYHPYPYAPYYYAPRPPAYYAAPQPSCYTQSGYWSQAPVHQANGFTTYQNVWVPPQEVCR